VTTDAKATGRAKHRGSARRVAQAGSDVILASRQQ
jgi:hypothetical protein